MYNILQHRSQIVGRRINKSRKQIISKTNESTEVSSKYRQIVLRKLTSIATFLEEQKLTTYKNQQQISPICVRKANLKSLNFGRETDEHPKFSSKDRHILLGTPTQIAKFRPET